MTTVTELIAFLRERADELEERLEYGELSDKLSVQSNTYWVRTPYIAMSSGFIDLTNPGGDREDY